MDRPSKITFTGLIWIILVTGLFAALMGTIKIRSKEKALRAECASNLHQIGLALLQYANEHGGAFPAGPGVVKSTKDAPGVAPPGSGEESLGVLYDVYVPVIYIFRCPEAPEPRDSARHARPAVGGRNPSFREYDFCSYAYDPRHNADHPANVAIVGDRGGERGVNSPNHKRDDPKSDGQSVLYVDGHAKWKTITNCGYDGDEIYVRNDELADPRKDTWLINGGDATWSVRTRRRRTIALLLALAAAIVLPPVIYLVVRNRRRRKAAPEEK